MPAGEGDEVAVAAGEIYLHNRSGARKATGSYFTKPFAVEHLLDQALEPALDDHLARLKAMLDEGDAAAAGEAFFDFRLAAGFRAGARPPTSRVAERLAAEVLSLPVGPHLGEARAQVARAVAISCA